MRIIAEISETTRKIKLPIDRVLSVNGDYQVDEIAFKLPDTYEGDFDFRTGVTRVHWKGADGAEHAEVLVSVDSSGRPLWVLPAALTQGGDGGIEFSVSFSTTDESDHLTQRWKTKPAAFRNERGIGGNDEQAEDDEIYDRLASAVASVRAAQAEVEDTNAVLSSLTGSAPVPVGNRSDMVDNGHLYLYTGDETGFVTGNLYYYVNGTLTNGGPYGAVTLDATLSQSGQAADAAAVGEALDDIDADVAQIKEDLSAFGLAGYLAKNLKSQGTPSENTTLDVTTGETATASGKTTTDFIDVSGKYVFLSGYNNLCFYDFNKNPIISTQYYTITGDDLLWEPGTITKNGTEVAHIYAKRTPKANAMLKPASSIIITSAVHDNNGVNFSTSICEYNGNTFIKRTVYNATNRPDGVPMTHTFSDNCTKFRIMAGRAESTGVVFKDSDIQLVSYQYAYSGKGDYDIDGGVRVTLPTGAVYIRVTTDDFTQFGIFASEILDYLSENPQESDTPTPTPTPTGDKKVLYTVGDSITKGTYAEIGASMGQGTTDKPYPYWIATINNFELHNLGVSGTGWVCGTQNGPYIADNNTFANADYITIAYGVNDYKSTSAAIGSIATSTLNDATIIGKMRYTIETIIAKAPQAKIIILRPLNGNRVWDNVNPVEADNWYMGTAISGRTLGEVSEAIKEVAEYYGIECLDQAQLCPVNRKNIRTLMGDGLHPSLHGHEMIGRSLAPFIH